MSKHTPGPWRALKNNETWIVGDRSFAVADVVSEWRRPDEREANAHLIAAAPEMLEALKGVVKYKNDDDWFEKVQAAIAKAEGRE